MNIDTAALRLLVENTEPINYAKLYPTSTTAAPIDTFPSNGTPLPGSAPASGAGTAYDINSAGAIPLPTPGVGEELRLIQANANNPMVGGFMLMDRLVATSGIDLNTTTPQAVNTVALPSRAGSGDGVEAFLFTPTGQISSNPAAPITISYTNQNGVSGKVGALTSINGTVRTLVIQKFALEPGDSCQSVQSIAATVAGSIGANWGILLAKRVCSVATSFNVSKQQFGGAALGFPKIEPDACLSLWMYGTVGLTGMGVDLQIASVPI